MTLQEMSHTYRSQHAVLRQRIRELTAAGQTALTLEALAVESRFAELFTDEEINACLEQLVAAGYYKI